MRHINPSAEELRRFRRKAFPLVSAVPLPQPVRRYQPIKFSMNTRATNGLLVRTALLGGKPAWTFPSRTRSQPKAAHHCRPLRLLPVLSGLVHRPPFIMFSEISAALCCKGHPGCWYCQYADGNVVNKLCSLI